MENELIETEKKIYKNYKKLAYSFSLLSCYFQQLSSSNPKESIQFEKIYQSRNKIDTNISFTISKKKMKNKMKHQK